MLCGVYARREANYGNIDLARKVFDMALLSVDGLPVVCTVFSAAMSFLSREIFFAPSLWGYFFFWPLVFLCLTCR